MICQFCGSDPELIVLVPIKKENGAFESLACLSCSIEKGVYCVKHDCPHTGFMGDDSTACSRCIDERVTADLAIAEEIRDALYAAFPFDEWERLQETAEMVSDITDEEEPICIYRFIVTMALRRGITPHEIFQQLVQEQSADMILPIMYF